MSASPAGNTVRDQIRHHLDLIWPSKSSRSPITSSEHPAWMHPHLTFPSQWDSRGGESPAVPNTGRCLCRKWTCSVRSSGKVPEREWQMSDSQSSAQSWPHSHCSHWALPGRAQQLQAKHSRKAPGLTPQPAQRQLRGQGHCCPCSHRGLGQQDIAARSNIRCSKRASLNWKRLCAAKP